MSVKVKYFQSINRENTQVDKIISTNLTSFLVFWERILFYFGGRKILIFYKWGKKATLKHCIVCG
jgi:hypothetical protein